MILSARFLTNVGSVNDFGYTQNVEFTEGDAVDVYFQLIDSTKDQGAEGFKPSGRRFMPASGATLTALVDNIDTAKQVTRSCTQPYANDPSIWLLTLLATDAIKGTANLKLTLVESSVTRRALVKNAIRVYPASNV